MKKTIRIKDLTSILNCARKEYYQNSNEIMSNKEYDRLYDELVELEKETGFILNNSPSQNIGYEIKDSLVKINHKEKMLSLDKTKDREELKKFLGDNIGILSWKLDGLTIVLTYKNGILKNAVTRGNGIVGTDVLHIAKQIKNIPAQIKYRGILIVRGECLISYSDFKQININNKYQNPRNLASGTIMSLDSKIAKDRQLQFYAFNLVQTDIDFKNSFNYQLTWLKEQGFDTVDYKIVTSDVLDNYISEFEQDIKFYDLPSDGLVLTYDDLEYRDSLGSTAHHPQGWLAFKWKDEVQETTLRDIEFQVGRTGVLTPIAVFDEVEIDGTNVTKASIHNISILKSLKLGIGDTITVYKSNMIIPQIDDNLTKSDTFKIPDRCPVCNENLEIIKSDRAEFLHCTNPCCSAKLIQKISHYCSRNAMDIRGLSDATLEKFIKKGFIKNLLDIYKIDKFKNEIINMEGFGVKSYRNLIDSIEKSKKAKLENFLFGIGIDNVGISTSKDICKYFKDNLNNIISANKDEYLKIKDIGEIVANSICNYFNNSENINILEGLLSYLEFKTRNEEINSNGIFKDKKIYCTGTFANYKKNQLKEIVLNNGGIFANGYAKSLDYLIVGSVKGSSKVDKAEKDGIEVISEDDFIKMLK